MQIVIDIPEEKYKHIQEEQWLPNRLLIEKAIANGIPLPKGHGRLIDVDEIVKDMNTFQGSFAINISEIGHNILNIKCLAPTVIPADKDGD